MARNSIKEAAGALAGLDELGRGLRKDLRGAAREAYRGRKPSPKPEIPGFGERLLD